MAADGNTAPISESKATEAPVSGDTPHIMPMILPEATGAITAVALSNIAKPAEGTIRVVDTGNSPELNFAFQASDVKITALDVDLVIIFKDNSKIILPSLAMDLVGVNPPRMKFNGTTVSAQSVVSLIGHTDLVDIAPSVQLSSLDFLPKKKGGNTDNQDQSATGHDGVGGGEPPIPPQPVVSGAKSGKSGENDGAKTAEFTSPPVEKVQAGAVATAGSSSAISSPSVVTTTKAEPLNNANSYAFDAPVFAKLYQIVEASPNKGSNGGVTTFYGGSGASPADTDPSFAAQSKAETITGTTGNDNIYADNPDYSSAGRAGRIISLTPGVTGYTFSKMTISGIPDGYTILDVQSTGKDAAGHLIYQIDPKTLGSNEFQFKLAYTVPYDTTAAKFALSLSFEGVQSTSQSSATVTSSVYVQVSDVVDDSHQITINSTDGRTVINLSLLPAGNSIAGNGGDDTIHAAAGADTIDGGSGNSAVAYDMSRLGVSVNLLTGHGYGGFAQGDTYTNIHNIIGSTASDTLIGDNSGDSIDGKGGHDSILGGTGNDIFVSNGSGNTIDGGDGYDTLDFTNSTSAITVDIGAGQATSAGSNAYDVIKNIEAVRGTSLGDDMLVSGNTPTWLFAGAGNDTVVSGPGADTLDGGQDTDTLSYITSTAGVSVSLFTDATHTQLATGGFATGDVIQNFENVIGSNHDDTLIGSTGNNVLDARGGNDSLDGGGGTDTFLGGAGNDSFTGDSHANYISGGAGNDTIDATSGGADTVLGGTGNDVLKLDWSSLNLSNLDGGAGTDTVVLSGTGSVSLNFTASAFTGVLTNAEYLDFSNATSSNNVSVNLDGAGIQKILSGATSNTNAGVLDLKLDAGHFDTLTLAANGSYSYWTAASGGTQISNGASVTTINLSSLNTTGADIYVFDSTHTTLLADLHYHV